MGIVIDNWFLKLHCIGSFRHGVHVAVRGPQSCASIRRQRDEREIRREMTDQRSRSSGEFARALGRAFAGAILFAFPLLMTMEMWWLGGVDKFVF